MKQHALIGLADLENVTNLRCRPTLDITQADHHTLSRWQNIDCRRDHRARLRRLELDLRPLAPRQREREPTPGIGPVGTEKPIDRDSPLIISSFGLKTPTTAPFVPPEPPRFSRCSKRSETTTSPARNAPQNDPDLGAWPATRPAPRHPPRRAHARIAREPAHRSSVRVHQLNERTFIASPERSEQVFV
jgi:hypothetical protein